MILVIGDALRSLVIEWDPYRKDWGCHLREGLIHNDEDQPARYLVMSSVDRLLLYFQSLRSGSELVFRL